MVIFEILKKIIPEVIQNRIKKIVLKHYTCPFCENKIRQFKPIGNDFPIFEEKQIIPPGRRRESCPICKSTDRERLVYIYLLKFKQIFQQKIRILHIAPERNLGEVLLKHFKHNYHAGDFFAECYENQPSYVKHMDLTDLPFNRNSFDLIICNHVLEHIKDEEKALAEIYRVLKPKGEAILQVPISLNSNHTFEDPAIVSPKEREKFYCQFNHVRLYGQDYPERLKKVGLEPKRINISKKYSKYRLNKKEDIFIGKKSS